MKISFQKYTRVLTTSIIVILFSISLWQLLAAGWIQGKAIIAQQLLNHSWDKTLDDSITQEKSVPHKPWPWADTWPVAKLIVPQYDIEQIVLAGDAGNSLAFAPGYSLASARPNTPGTTIISAHRDTHFQFLKNLKIGETFYLQTTKKNTHYFIYDLQVVDTKTYTVQIDSNEQTLILATCYPFDAILAGGSLRFLVFAKPVILS